MQKLARVGLRLFAPLAAILMMQVVVVQVLVWGSVFWLGSREQALIFWEGQPLLAMLYTIPAIPLFLAFFAQDVRKRPVKRTPQGLGGTLAWAALLGMGTCVTLNMALDLSGLWRYAPYYTQQVAAALFTPPLWQQILLTVILTPVCEEIVFRGLMFRGLRETLTFGAAAVLSAAMFGIFHGNLYQGMYAFGVGLLLAWVYEKTHALIAPMVLHCWANLTSVVLSMPTVQTQLMLYPAGALAMELALVLLVPVSVVIISKRTMR